MHAPAGIITHTAGGYPHERSIAQDRQDSGRDSCSRTDPVRSRLFGVGAVAANALTLPKRDFAAGVTPAKLGLPYEDVRFAARDGAAEIGGWCIPGDAEAPVIIMVHGRDASRTAAVGGGFLEEAKLLHDAGYGVLIIDLRGHGQSSDARFTFGIKERSDVLGAVDWLLLRGVVPRRIGVLGLSLGAAAAIGAARRPAGHGSCGPGQWLR